MWGSDVEGLIRDLVEAAIVLVRNAERLKVAATGQGTGRAAPFRYALAGCSCHAMAGCRCAPGRRGCRTAAAPRVKR